MRAPHARALCLAFALALALSLFALGGEPYAGKLFPAPWDKLAHLSLFAAITLLVWLGVEGRAPLALAALVLSIGLLDELHQVALPGRSADPGDLLADACGIGVAFFLLRARKPALKGKP